MIRTALALATLALTAAAAEPPLVNLIPADVKVIGGMNVARTLSSPFGRYLLNQMKEDDPNLRRIIDETGFDPRRDLRDVVFASPVTGGKRTGLVIARGVFNGPQILAAIQKKGGTTSTYRGVSLIVDPKGEAAVGIVDGSLAFAGEQRLVRAAIDLRDATAAPTDLARKASGFDGRYDAWIVTSGVKLPAGATSGAPAPMAPPAAALAAIQESSAGVEFGSVVRITAEAVTRSDKDAQALVDVVKFISGMAQLNRDNPGMQQFEAIVNSMTVSADANTVKFSVAVPEADLEQIVKPRRQSRRAGL
jgi:hypothetical protein